MDGNQNEALLLFCLPSFLSFFVDFLTLWFLVRKSCAVAHIIIGLIYGSIFAANYFAAAEKTEKKKRTHKGQQAMRKKKGTAENARAEPEADIATEFGPLTETPLHVLRA